MSYPAPRPGSRTGSWPDKGRACFIMFSISPVYVIINVLLFCFFALISTALFLAFFFVSFLLVSFGTHILIHIYTLGFFWFWFLVSCLRRLLSGGRCSLPVDRVDVVGLSGTW